MYLSFRQLTHACALTDTVLLRCSKHLHLEACALQEDKCVHKENPEGSFLEDDSKNSASLTPVGRAVETLVLLGYRYVFWRLSVTCLVL